MAFSLGVDGFFLVEAVLTEAEVDRQIHYLQNTTEIRQGHGGIRNLLDFSAMRELVESSSVRRWVDQFLGVKARAVRGILFDKTEAANWKVPWHQDVTIAVAKKIETDGYGPWSTKAGVLHVQPPAAVLERMISIRIHLDDCPEENGALKVIKGSHTQGKLNERVIEERTISAECDVVCCEVLRGGALIMRPLLIHSSSASKMPGHRRVLHFDFADVELPGEMQWAVD